jgi:endonuclease/exonuclease/phosphatase family metal-dependent hydrolase
VILCQEVRQGDGLPNTAEALAVRLGAYTGAPWRSSFGSAVVGPPGTWGQGTGAGEEGLAILTPHELGDPQVVELPEARPLDRRVLLSGRITMRGAYFAVHTTHLHWRLADGLAREKQVVAVDELARAYAGSTVHVVGGDFNAAPENDEIRFLRGETTLAGRRAVWQDVWRGQPDPGFTWARKNPSTAWLAHLALDRRIDYLFVSPEQRSGHGKVLSAKVVLDAADARSGVFPSDHFGVLAEIVVG